MYFTNGKRYTLEYEMVTKPNFQKCSSGYKSNEPLLIWRKAVTFVKSKDGVKMAARAVAEGSFKKIKQVLIIFACRIRKARVTKINNLCWHNKAKRWNPMTITEVSEKFGLSQDTLRYYERIGLIPNVSRNKSGIRDYTEEDCRWHAISSCWIYYVYCIIIAESNGSCVLWLQTNW